MLVLSVPGCAERAGWVGGAEALLTGTGFGLWAAEAARFVVLRAERSPWSPLLPFALVAIGSLNFGAAALEGAGLVWCGNVIQRQSGED